MRKDFDEKTDNICVQILNGNLIRNTEQGPHRCRNKGLPKLKETSRVDDKWFYFFDEDSNPAQPVYKFYRMTAG